MAEWTLEQIAHFQAALLELLSAETSLEEVRRRLRSEPALAPFRAYLEQAEPRMLEVALELTKKWGRSGSKSLDPSRPLVRIIE